ncbi:DUF7619 domain-containing protein [Taibaiella chishuiensis]|uniref:Putative secreted protein (Por secretion system target) n=1 Tax=Taibaiella chishuiensis TaxID=1434707 RepID=A0A2P8CYP0_9BACT|nr:T9SS type A sorting domain-containing protein [Taibaiella chishuiensis]PSK90046.1 putative secreted protein (Por secretion system target) [Taibaiella chishuiensis]
MYKKILQSLCLAAGVMLAEDAAAQSVSITLTQAPCNNNGILTAHLSGLSYPVTLQWNVIGVVTTHSNINTPTDQLTGYSGAAVSVTATGSNGLSVYASFSAPPFTYTTTSTPAACPALGTATATPSGGVAPYTYQWLNASNTIVSTSNPASLPAGQYSVKITDANGCVSGSHIIPDSLFIQGIAPFNFNITTTPANCTNGTAAVGTITGTGLAPYSYAWSNGASTPSISNLTQGVYSVTVTDANGCSRDRIAEVTQAVQIGVNTTPTNSTCLQNNGAIMVFGSGGTPPYSYLYGNGATTQTQTNLAPGYYPVTVTDANGCTGHGGGYIGTSTPVNVTYSATPSSCTAATGTATLSISGGQAPYTTNWSTFPAQTGTTANNLPAGSCSFTVTDANGCVRTGTAVIPPVATVAVNMTGSNASCTSANGSIVVTPSGGAAPYTYSWNTGASTATLNSLAAGIYTVTVTDANGCATTRSRNISTSSPVHVGLVSTPASCIFTGDGSILATASGGTAPYTYSWSNGQTTANATGLHAGNYNVHVTDANGCTGGEYTGLGYNTANSSCYCTISGTVYHDMNNNCVRDAGEPGIPNILIHCSNSGSVFTDANGQYAFQVPSGTYTVSENVLGMYPLASCQSNTQSVTTTAGTGCVQTVNFANTVNPIHDMQISTWDFTAAVPGNTYVQKCIVSNQGTVAEPAAIASYNTDGQLNTATFVPSGIFGASGANRYTTGSGMPNLAPGTSAAFNINYNVPTNIPMATLVAVKDSVAYTSPMSNWLSDYSPWNNVNQVNTTVVSSYDPNFKQVIPQGIGAAGNIERADSNLQYMVHFQNLGTYFAQNIVVIDTLDPDLDWKTLRPVYSSHKTSNIQISETGVLKYTYKNINLPAKMHDEAGSNGMFTYSIRTRSNLPLGTVFTNTAAIYFDYNEPVITNTTTNTLYKPTSVDNPAVGDRISFMIYPNPASASCSILLDNKTAKDATLTVADISGRVLLRKDTRLYPGKQAIEVSTGALIPGVYFVSLSAGATKTTQKLVILK